MPTVPELRRRVQRKTSNLYDTLFTRRVSIYLTKGLAPTGVSANGVSFANLGVAVLACLGIGAGVETWQILGGIGLVHLYAVLDSVDGELARLRTSFTIKGLFLEDLSAFVMINGFFLATAAYLTRTTGMFAPMVLAVAAVAFGRNAMQVARRAILKWLESERPVPTGGPAQPARASGLGRVRRLVEEHLLHYTNVRLVLTSLIALEVLTDVGTYHLVWYSFLFYCAAVLLKEILAIGVFVFTDELHAQGAAIVTHVRAMKPESK